MTYQRNTSQTGSSRFPVRAAAACNNLPNLKHALESWNIFKACAFQGSVWVLESWSEGVASEYGLGVGS